MRCTTYRRFSTECEVELGVVEAYLAEGSIKGLATKAGIDHSQLHSWLKKYRAGELWLDLWREEQLVETAQDIWAPSGKWVGSRWVLTCSKAGSSPPRDEQRAVVDHLRAGGIGPTGDVA